MLLSEMAPGQAPCSGLTDLFFDEWNEESAAEAKALCMRCPAQIDCLYQSARRRERDGIAGGVSFRPVPDRVGRKLIVRPSEWARLLEEHQALADARGLHAVAVAVVSEMREGGGRRAG